MEFKRRKIKGRTKANYREWHDTAGLGYRVTWRSEVEGVRVRPGYHACVRSTAPYQHYEFWSFSTARRPFKTLASAVEACEKNERLWRHFLALADERKGRAEKVRALDAKAQIGHGAAAHKIMSIIPVWVNKVVPPVLLRILYPVGKLECDEDLNDPPSVSMTSGSISSPTNGDDATSSATLGPGLALSAKEEAPPTEPRRRGAGKRAKVATDKGSGNAKRLKRSTKKPSKSTKRRAKSTSV